MPIFMPFGGAVDPADILVSYADLFAASDEPVAPYDRITARLLINAAEIPHADFTYSEPKGSLGGNISVRLAYPDKAQLPVDGVYVFQIGYERAGVMEWRTLIDSGRMTGYQMGRGWSSDRNRHAPADELSFTANNSLADRWNLAPEATTIFYDGLRTEVAAPPPSLQGIRDPAGAAIVPVINRFDGLTLYKALHEAYVVGCQFASVITNIPDHPLSRVEFGDSEGGGYHAGIAPLVGMFRPRYWADINNNLYIAWPGADLPVGYEVRDVLIRDYKRLSESVDLSKRTNRLDVSYTVDDAAGDYFTVRQDDEVTVNGALGDPDYTEVRVRTTVHEWRMTAAPGVVVREEIAGKVSKSYDWNLTEIDRDALTETFDSMGRKTGHDRVVMKMLPTVGGVLELQTAEEEHAEIAYGPNPLNPNETIMLRQVTRKSGAVLQLNDTLYLGEPLKAALPIAHINGYLDPDENNAIIQRPLKTTYEEFRPRGGQVGVQITVINTLRGIVESSKWVERPGTVRVPNRKVAQRSKRLTVPDSVNRPAQKFATGELPQALALQVAWRELFYRYDPPHSFDLELSIVDDSVRKGMLVTAHDRAEFPATYRIFVDSRTIRGSRAGIQMSVTCELLPDVPVML